ncbi:unnamed protein product, partial [Polarella glacialis]
ASNRGQPLGAFRDLPDGMSAAFQDVPEGDSFEMPELSHTSYGGVGCLVVLSAFFAAISVGSVEPLTYGIRYNGFNKYAEVDRVYHNGRYFIGPWNSFVLFPAVAQTIEFSNQPRLVSSGTRKDAHWHREGYAALHTRTKEGLALDLEVSLQYKLKENEVGLLYEEFNTNYQAMFTSTIRDTLIKAAAEYEAYQLWEERKQVGDRMQELVNEVLAVTYAECWGLQLLDISLPAEFDKSIVATQIQSQTIATMQYLQVATKTRAETRVIEAEFARKVKVIRAGARANYTLTTKVARAKAKQTILNAEASVLGQARTRLKLAAADLVEYQHCNVVKQMSNASLYYGFGQGSQVLLTAPAASRGEAGGPSQRRLDGSDAAAETEAVSQRLHSNDEL